MYTDLMVRRNVPRTRTGYRKDNGVIWRYTVDTRTSVVQERTKVRKRDDDYEHASRLVGDTPSDGEEEEDLMIGRNLPESEPRIPRIRTVERGEDTETAIPSTCCRRCYNAMKDSCEDSACVCHPDPWDVDDEPDWAKPLPVTFVEPRNVYQETMEAMGLEEL